MIARITSLRSLTVIATLGAAVVAMSSSSATPFAGTVHTASAAFAMKGSDSHDYRVTVTLESATSPGAAPQLSLQVAIANCAFQTCGSEMMYAKTLKASEGSVADDLSTATLQTTFAGLPLKLSWSGGGGTQTAVSVSVDPQGSGIGVGDPASGDAGAGGSVLGVNCFADGSIKGSYLVAPNGSPTLDGAAPPSHTPAAFARAGGRGPRCVKG